MTAPKKRPAKKKAAKKRPAKKKTAEKISKKRPAKKPAQTKKKTARGRPPGEQQQMPFEGDDTSADMHYPAGTIAGMLMITTRRLRQLAAEGIVPKSTRGRYPLEGCVKGYVQYLQKMRQSSDEQSKESTRLTRARADDIELELQLKQGKIYRREVVDEALFQACTGLIAMLDGSASRIATQLGGGASLRKRLVEEFREIRNQYASSLREFSGRLRADGWDRRPTTRSRARSVGTRKPRAAARKP